MNRRGSIRLRLTYEKAASLRFISHRDLIRVLGRTFRRIHAPLAHTQGYSPRPKLSFAPPLPLGIVGKAELLDLELEHHVDENDFIEQINENSPMGLVFKKAELLLDGAPALSKIIFSARYCLDARGSELEEPDCREILERKSIEIEKKRKKDKEAKQVEVRPLLIDLHHFAPNEVEAEVKASPQTISPFVLAKLLWPNIGDFPLDVLDISRLGFVSNLARPLFRLD